MSGTISVIIPIYKVERYLRECLDSVVNQSYRDLEILLIDDGSPDGCGAICDEYAAGDTRIRVIHQKNGGAANAKNTGLRAATGEYLAFLDGDDYLETDAYERMLKELTASGADVVQCSFRDVYVNKTKDCVMVPNRREYSTVEYLRRYTRDWTCGLLWDKLYRRSLFDGVFFEEGHKIDDEYFTYQGIMNAHRILHLPDFVYNYRKRRSAVTQSADARQQIVLDRLDYLQKRRTKVLARFPELKQDFDLHYLSMLLLLSRDPSATEESIRLVQKKLREYNREGNPCKAEFALRRRLFFLQHASPARLLKMRSVYAPGYSENVLFE